MDNNTRKNKRDLERKKKCIERMVILFGSIQKWEIFKNYIKNSKNFTR